MKVKIAYLKDYQEYVTALSQWSFDTWGKYNPKATRKSQIDKFKQHCNIDTLPLTLIALNDNYELIGMCSLRESDGVRMDLSPWLGSLYVIPSYRGKKVGEKLIDAAKRVAKNFGFDMLYLLTFEQDLNKYYQNLGWSLFGKDELNNFSISLMECKLTG